MEAKKPLDVKQIMERQLARKPSTCEPTKFKLYGKCWKAGTFYRLNIPLYYGWSR